MNCQQYAAAKLPFPIKSQCDDDSVNTEHCPDNGIILSGNLSSIRKSWALPIDRDRGTVCVCQAPALGEIKLRPLIKQILIIYVE